MAASPALTCTVDLFTLCPSHNVCHHDMVVLTMHGDEWFTPLPRGISTPSLIRRIVTRITRHLTTSPSPQGTERTTLMDFDFEAAILTHSYVEAQALIDGKVPVYDRTTIDA